MKRKLKFERKRLHAMPKWRRNRPDFHNLYLKAKNVLARFASLLRLFQIRASLNSKLFCPEDVLNRGIRRSVLELRSILL